jgi:hypothetical protein
MPRRYGGTVQSFNLQEVCLFVGQGGSSERRSEGCVGVRLITQEGRKYKEKSREKMVERAELMMSRQL